MSAAERASRAKLDRILTDHEAREVRTLADLKNLGLGIRSIDHARQLRNDQLETARNLAAMTATYERKSA